MLRNDVVRAVSGIGRQVQQHVCRNIDAIGYRISHRFFSTALSTVWHSLAHLVSSVFLECRPCFALASVPVFGFFPMKPCVRVRCTIEGKSRRPGVPVRCKCEPKCQPTNLAICNLQLAVELCAVRRTLDWSTKYSEYSSTPQYSSTVYDCSSEI